MVLSGPGLEVSGFCGLTVGLWGSRFRGLGFRV